MAKRRPPRAKYVTVSYIPWRGKPGTHFAGKFVPKGSPLAAPSKRVTYQIPLSRLKRTRHPTTRKYIGKKSLRRWRKKTFDWRDAIEIIRESDEEAARLISRMFKRAPRKTDKKKRFYRVVETMTEVGEKLRARQAQARKAARASARSRKKRR